MADDPVQRKWLPHAYQDEVVPPPLPHPSDWIIGSAGDLWGVGDSSDPTLPDTRLMVRPGEVIEFDWVESFGEVELRVAADRSWSAAPEPDPRAEMFYAGDPATLGTDLGQVAKAIADMMALPAAVDVTCYRWGGPVPWRLVVDEAGARFVEVTGRA